MTKNCDATSWDIKMILFNVVGIIFNANASAIIYDIARRLLAEILYRYVYLQVLLILCKVSRGVKR